MRQFISPAVLLSGFVFMSACSEDRPEVADDYEFVSVVTTFESRGVAVPATLVTPSGGTDDRFPLVVMAHGHGGSREEAGGFGYAARALAKRGIATIRMDFPGCGDSSESFTENNLSNMLLDLQAAREFAVTQPAIDSNRTGLLGYSMGGRLVSMLSAIDPSYRVMAIWTPSVENGAGRERREFAFLQGPSYYDMVREQALETGMAEYTTRWGSNLQVGPRWFLDLEQTNPLEAIAKFRGPLLVLYGDADDVVPPAVSEAAIAAAVSSIEVERHVVASAGHALGFYTNRPEIAAEVVETTAEFLAERL